MQPTTDKGSGNAQLAAKGARWLPATEGKLDIRQLFERPLKPEGLSTLFDHPVIPNEAAVGEDQEVVERKIVVAAGPGDEDEINSHLSGDLKNTPITISYEYFLRRIKALTEKEAKTADELLKELGISKSQLNVWLKRATEEGELKKKKGPVRYAWLPSKLKPKQTAIF